MIFVPPRSDAAAPEIVTASPTRNSAPIAPSVEKRMRRYTLSTAIHSCCASDHWRSTRSGPERSIQYAPFDGEAGSWDWT